MKKKYQKADIIYVDFEIFDICKVSGMIGEPIMDDEPQGEWKW